MTAGVASQEQARDLEADLAICEAATPGLWQPELDDPHVVPGEYWSLFVPPDGSPKRVEIAGGFRKTDALFAAGARTGWPYAIRRAMEAENENDRLRNELNILQEQCRHSELRIYQEQRNGGGRCFD